jgi:hypothetical protein
LPFLRICFRRQRIIFAFVSFYLYLDFSATLDDHAAALKLLPFGYRASLIPGSPDQGLNTLRRQTAPALLITMFMGGLTLSWSECSCVLAFRIALGVKQAQQLGQEAKTIQHPLLSARDARGGSIEPSLLVGKEKNLDEASSAVVSRLRKDAEEMAVEASKNSC